jgi:hypothetical protein
MKHSHIICMQHPVPSYPQRPPAMALRREVFPERWAVLYYHQVILCMQHQVIPLYAAPSQSLSKRPPAMALRREVFPERGGPSTGIIKTYLCMQHQVTSLTAAPSPILPSAHLSPRVARG